MAVYGFPDRSSYERMARSVRKTDALGIRVGEMRVKESHIGVRLGKTDAAISKGSSGVVSVYTGTAGSETDSGKNITAWNKFANVESGKWVAAMKIGVAWYLIAAEC